jgi:hypothetical protein
MMTRTSFIAGLLFAFAVTGAGAQGVTSITPAFPGVQPPVPSPVYPQPPVVQAVPRVKAPKRIESFGDRTTNCLHSFPLEAGKGNNPVNRDAYVRSCAN